MIERKIIIGLIISNEYSQQVVPIWKPKLLKSKTAQTIGEWCVEYFQEYGKVPDRDIEAIFFEKVRLGEIREEEAEDIEEILESLSEEYGGNFNVSFYIKKTNEYLHERSLESLSERIRELLDAGELEEAEKIAATYNSVLAESKPDLDLSDGNVLLRLENAFNDAYSPILSYPGALGEMWNDQLIRGNFIALMAPEKRGKTFWLLDMAIRAARQGSKVAFFQAGDMTENQQLKRISSYLTKKPDKEKYCGVYYEPVRDCVRNQLDVCEKIERECAFGPFSNQGYTPKTLKTEITFSDLVEAYKSEEDYSACRNCKEWDFKRLGVPWLTKGEIKSPVDVNEAKEKITEFFIKRKRSFKLSTHPNRTLSVSKIKTILKRWEREEGFVPDFIVVDYADIMIDSGSKDFRHQQNEIWMGLRSLNQEYNCLLATATQADAQSYKTDTLNLSNYSEDKRKYAHVTSMYGLNQDKDGREKKIGLMRINEIVVREGSFESTSSVTVLQNLNLGRPFLGSYK